MLLVWHGNWKRHIYEEGDTTGTTPPYDEDEFYLSITTPPIYRLRNVVITYSRTDEKETP